MPPRPYEKQYQEKARLLVLLKMFYELTDEEHTLTNTEILEYLKNNNVSANMRTIRDDILLLNSFGFDIETIKSRPNRYYWGERTFELPELKLLVDAVSSSRFITEKKSKELAKKLYNFTSKHQRRGIKRNITVTKRVKTDNESIYYIIDTVNEAINKKRKIAFKYTEYSVSGEKVFRNDGEVYELSPYTLFWNDDYYYVIGWSDKHDNISVFRADRLCNTEILKEKAKKQPKDFNLEDYSKRIFEMYDGESVEVRLECKDELAKYIVDRFGDKLHTKSDGNGFFEVTVGVSLSPNFYAWVFRFGGDIRILAPKEAVGEYSSMLKKAITIQSL